MWRLEDYAYDLSEHLIAQHPLRKRDQARLMVIERKSGKIMHSRFDQLEDFLPSRSLLVVNNSKVIPARLLGHKERSGGKVEIFLLHKLEGKSRYTVLMKPMRKIKTGDRIRFDGHSVTAVIEDKDRSIVRFDCSGMDRVLRKIGHIPLPPYMRRQDIAADREDYQTVYARYQGSVASPTAGLHFTRPLLNGLKRAGHKVCSVTLHINYATFKPVEAPDIRNHQMHAEDYSMPAAVDRDVRQARQDGRSVVAVGTTACRVLETVAANRSLKGSTDIFIYPGYRFQSVDALITNFHLPYSTLLMLVYAFGGAELMRRAYAEAVKAEYRFYSYGDGMLIL